MKRKKEIEGMLRELKQPTKGLTTYDLGWRAGARWALRWVLEKVEG